MARPRINPEQNDEQITPAQKLYLAALREILPQLSTQGDDYLQKRIEKLVGKEKLTDAALDLEGYINAGVEGTLMQNERLALATKLLKFLSEYIQGMNPPLPVTLNTIINSMPLLAHAAEQHFPGYASSKLLRYTVVPLQHRQRVQI